MGSVTVVTKRSDDINANACVVTSDEGFRTLPKAQFAADRGFHMVVTDISLDPESEAMHLTSLIDFCHSFFLLRPRIDFKLLLINETESKVELAIAFSKAKTISERIQAEYSPACDGLH